MFKMLISFLFGNCPPNMVAKA